MSQLTLYYNPVSPYSRPIKALLISNSIDYQEKVVDLTKGEHKSEEFLKINPQGQIPAIKHGEFCLSECSAIMKYITRAFQVERSLYPLDDAEQIALIDRAIFWAPIGLFAPLNQLFRNALVEPLLQNKPKDNDIDQQSRKLAKEGFENFERLFLTKTPFSAGDWVTIADFYIACQLQSLDVLEKVGEQKVDIPPKVKEWLDKVNSVKGMKEINAEQAKAYEGIVQMFKAKKQEGQEAKQEENKQ